MKVKPTKVDFYCCSLLSNSNLSNLSKPTKGLVELCAAVLDDEVAVDDLLARHRVAVAQGVLEAGLLLRVEAHIPEADVVDLPVRGLAGKRLHEPELVVDEVAVVGLVDAVVVELLVVLEVVVDEVGVVGVVDGRVLLGRARLDGSPLGLLVQGLTSLGLLGISERVTADGSVGKIGAEHCEM